MAKNVVILGAGASFLAGAPLMFDFLDKAESTWKFGDVGRFAEDFKVVFAALHQLEHTLSKAVIDVNNLESVFGAFEMAKLVGKLGDIPRDSLESLAEHLQRVILRTLESTVRFGGDRINFKPPRGYEALMASLAYLHKQDTAFITFNYDLGLDVAIQLAFNLEPDYGLSESSSNSMRIYKLHGSMHWYLSPNGKLESIPLRDLIAHPWVQPAGTGTSHLFVSEKLGSLDIASPFIVPPSWRKGDHYSSIATIWEQAAQELEQAERILVCGFSLPDTDQYFRYLYALGTAGPTRIKRFIVCDPSPSVEGRFTSLLGQTAKQRFQYVKGTFEDFVNQIKTWTT